MTSQGGGAERRTSTDRLDVTARDVIYGRSVAAMVIQCEEYRSNTGRVKS